MLHSADPLEIPIANIYYLLCYAWETLDEKETLADVDALSSTELLDLFARVLINGTARLRRRGLDRGYVPREEAIAGVRGKLLTTRTLCEDLLRHGRTACRWDELEYDTLPNRILKTTLQRLRNAPELNRQTAASVRDTLRWFAPVRSLTIRAEHFRRVQLHRNNRIYSLLLHVCKFIHEHWLPDEQGNGRRFRDFIREGLDKLFEKFVFEFYRKELPEGEGWQVAARQFDWAVSHQNADARAMLPQMKTDVCLIRTGRAIIIDTKYYTETLKTGPYGGEKLPTGNLYQIFSYLRQAAHKPGWERAEGVLLYPRVSHDVQADFVTDGHRIRALTLDLNRPWREIHALLLAIPTSQPNPSSP